MIERMMKEVQRLQQEGPSEDFTNRAKDNGAVSWARRAVSLARVVRSSDGPSCCSRGTSFMTRSTIDSILSGAPPKLTPMRPAPRCGSGCARPTVDAVGLAELFAQDVAQRDLQHLGRGFDARLLVLLERRLGSRS